MLGGWHVRNLIGCNRFDSLDATGRFDDLICVIPCLSRAPFVRLACSSNPSISHSNYGGKAFFSLSSDTYCSIHCDARAHVESTYIVQRYPRKYAMPSHTGMLTITTKSLRLGIRGSGIFSPLSSSVSTSTGTVRPYNIQTKIVHNGLPCIKWIAKLCLPSPRRHLLDKKSFAASDKSRPNAMDLRPRAL